MDTQMGGQHDKQFGLALCLQTWRSYNALPLRLKLISHGEGKSFGEEENLPQKKSEVV